MPDIKPIPDGYHSITPYLSFKDANAAIQFYERAFGAREVLRLKAPGGGVAHAEIEIGNSRIMMADENPVYGNKSAQTLGGSPASFMIYVEDVDAAFDRAVQAGAKVKYAVKDQFYGDRTGTLLDPFGYQWSIATHKQEVAIEDMQREMQKMYATAHA